MGRVIVWKDCPNGKKKFTKHGWAFYYYLKKQGEDVSFKQYTNDNIDIIIKEKGLF